jgi:hypothetical protein
MDAGVTETIGVAAHEPRADLLIMKLIKRLLEDRGYTAEDIKLLKDIVERETESLCRRAMTACYSASFFSARRQRATTKT